MLRTFRGGLLIGLAVAVAVAVIAIIYERYDTRTLKRTVKRGEVLCGVNKGLPGFSIPDDKGDWSGFDVDFCRAVAAAIFNDPKKTKFVPLEASERFKELQNRKVDILSRNSTWSMSRETNYDLYFPAVAYYDGQGFMLPRSRKINSSLDLNNSKVCGQEGTTTLLNLADYFRANNMKYTEMKFPKLEKSKKPDVMRLVGTEGSYGEDLGLTKDWAARIIRHVGNYGEVYERNVGAEIKTESSARTQFAVEQWRHPVRAVNKITRSGCWDSRQALFSGHWIAHS